MTSDDHPDISLAERTFQYLRSDRGFVYLSFPFLLLALVAVAATIWFYLLGEGTTFYRDEWDILYFRTLDSFESIVASHGGQHLYLMSPLFLGGVSLFGVDDYQYFRLMTVPIVGLCAFGIFLFSESRIGRWPAFLCASLLISFGASAEAALWPMVALTFAGICFLGILILFLLSRATIVGDIGAALVLCVAVSLSGFGLVLLPGVATYLLLYRPLIPYRLLVLAPASLIYGVWFLRYQTVDPLPPDGLSGYLTYSARLIDAGVTGLTGLSATVVLLILVAFVGLAIGLLAVGKVDRSRFWTAVAMLITFCLITAHARGGFDDPVATRYMFPTVFLLLLILGSIELRGSHYGLIVGLALFALLVVAAPHGISGYQEASRTIREHSLIIRAEFAAADVAGRETFESPQITPESIYGTPTSFHFFDMEDRYSSSPGLSYPELLNASPREREIADDFLFESQRVLEPLPPEPRRGLYQAASCRRLPAPRLIYLRLLPATSWIVDLERGAADIKLRRFGDSLLSMVKVRKGQTYVLSGPEDARPSIPWKVKILIRSGVVGVCEA